MVIPYVPTDRVDRFRVLDERAMADTCDIVHTEPGTINPDGSGEQGTVVTTASPCRVVPSGGSPQETFIVSRLTDQAAFTFYLPVAAVVSEQDTLTYHEVVYQIVGILNPTSYQTSLRVVTVRMS